MAGALGGADELVEGCVEPVGVTEEPEAEDFGEFDSVGRGEADVHDVHFRERQML